MTDSNVATSAVAEGSSSVPNTPRPAQSAAAARVGGGVGVPICECGHAVQTHAPDETRPCGACSCDGYEPVSEARVPSLGASDVREAAVRMSVIAEMEELGVTDPAFLPGNLTPTPAPAVADALARAEEGERMARIANVLSEFSEADAISLPVRYSVSPRFIADVRALAGQLARAEGEYRSQIDAFARHLADHPDDPYRAMVAEYMRENDLLAETARDLTDELDDVRARLAAAERVGEVTDDDVRRAMRAYHEWPDHMDIGDLVLRYDHAARSLRRALEADRAALPARPSTPAAEGENNG